MKKVAAGLSTLILSAMLALPAFAETSAGANATGTVGTGHSVVAGHSLPGTRSTSFGPGTIGTTGYSNNNNSAFGSSEFSTGATSSPDSPANRAGAAAGTAAGGAANAVGNAAAGAANAVGNVAAGAANAVGNVAAGAANAVGNVATGTANAVGNVATGTANAVGNVATGTANAVGTGVSRAMTGTDTASNVDSSTSGTYPYYYRGSNILASTDGSNSSASDNASTDWGWLGLLGLVGLAGLFGRNRSDAR